MAKPTVKREKNQPAIIERADQVFNDLGIISGSIRKTPTSITVHGTNHNNEAVTVHGANFHGYQEQRLTSFDGSTEDRKLAAKQLRRQGLSQAAIADRLGVSQKTISNDLRD